MSFLDHIRACNGFEPSRFLPFYVGNLLVGRVRPGFGQMLGRWPKVFAVTDGRVGLVPGLDSFEGRTEAVAGVLDRLLEEGVIDHLQGEPYGVTPSVPEQALMCIDRAAAPYFGVRAFGQHLNGFVREAGELKLWIARRSADRRNFPGKLDNLVAGGLPYGIGLHDNLLKECWEEAGIGPDLAQPVRPVGAVSYNAETPAGFKPDTLYCYDLELPGNFIPRCMDGEVETFYLWPVEKVMEIIRESDEFKLNCNLVVIDFMIRHGYIGPQDEDYLALLQGLRPPPSLL
jgi:8-oxo-dGTP pyrophosphatase MutT (NUDIX family)